MTHIYALQKKKEKLPQKVIRLFWYALLIRFIILIVVAVCSNFMESGFIKSARTADDWRYLKGAEIYASTARSLWDFNAFRNAYASLGDWIGYNVRNSGVFDSTPLWYCICCVIVYVFRTTWVVRILTVLFGALSVIYIYQFAHYIYGKSTALRAARLFAFLPYPVIFSCFAYKDHLFLLLMFFLFAKSSRYRTYKHLFLSEYLSIAFVILGMFLLRSGFTILIVGVALIVAINPNIKKLTGKQRLALAGLLTAGVALFLMFRPLIMYKLGHYMDGREDKLASNTISYLTVNSVFEIYKLPFSYVFATVSPVDVLNHSNSWYAVVANLNISLCPISVGSFMYLFDKKKDNLVYYGTLSLFLITIITSINIFRHYYSLMPFIMVYFAAFWEHANIAKKSLAVIASVFFAAVLIIFFGYRNLQ